MLNFLRHEVRIRRGSILGWAAGLAFFAVVYMAFYPALPPEMLELNLQEVEIYRALGVMEMATFEGYMASTVFNFLPLLLGIFAITSGANALAGEEDNGTLELLVALPLARWQVVLTKALAMTISALIVFSLVGLALMSGFAAIQSQFEATATAAGLFRITLSYLPITLVFMMLSLFLGAYLPHRRAAMVMATVALLFSYFGNNLANLVEGLRPVQRFLPFYYVDSSVTALVEGPAWGDLLLLLAVALVFLLLAVLSFARRNITVGAWPWQRPSKSFG